MSDNVPRGEAMLWAELGAVQMTMLAIIKTHPDRAALLKTLDSMIAGLQVQSAQAGGQTLPDSMRNALNRFRGQIAAQAND